MSAFARGRILCAFPLLATACGGEDGPVPILGAPTQASAQTPSTSAFQTATRRALPAVVYIQVEARPRRMPVPLGAQEPPRQGDLLPLGAGSGVIFTADGYILTNNHVVQQAERVTVTMPDRRTFEARVIARDPSTDIAVVKIDGENLPVAELGDSDQVELGQWVLALGSPLGLQFTVTAGIVSATGRSIGIIGTRRGEELRAAPLENFIQTDAAINPGNSGGPLVNLDGQVIGITTAIASPTGVFAGYGFAVPIDLARVVADQLIRFGEVRRPYLGVSLDEIDPIDVQVYELAAPQGVEVIHVEPQGPAARAGVQVGDVIVGIGEREVATVPELQVTLAALEGGQRVPLRIVRYGREVTVPVELGVVRSGVRPEGPVATDEPARAGFSLAQRGGRVIVAAVQPYSPAARAGIRPGQVIVSANRQEITTPQQLVQVIRNAPDGVLSLVVEDPQLGRTIHNLRVR